MTTLNSNIIQLDILADEFSHTTVIVRNVLRAVWFWSVIALILFLKFDWQISILTPILLFVVNLFQVLYKFYVNGKSYVCKISFYDDYLKIVYCDFNNHMRLRLIEYQSLRFTYYEKFRTDYFNYKSPITLSLYNADVLIENIRDGEVGWKIEQLEKLYDEILLRTLPYTKELKQEIPVKIKGTSKRRKQFPNTCPYCE